jgi:hypothetical protein
LFVPPIDVLDDDLVLFGLCWPVHLQELIDELNQLSFQLEFVAGDLLETFVKTVYQFIDLFLDHVDHLSG